MIGDKRLYEVGLPGRYNKLGEWKPLNYPSKGVEVLQKEAISISSNNYVQGAYFYILCTGHRIIEFVVRTSLEIPAKFFNKEGFHLYKCKKSKRKKSFEAIQIYDGWYELNSVKAVDIDAALNTISLILNTIGFTYNVSIDWRPKYSMSMNNISIASLKEDDIEILNCILKSIDFNEEEMLILSYALDWYVRGRTSKNIFVSFLSYYIVIESISSAVIEKDRISFGLDYCHLSKFERKKIRNEEIIRLHDESYLDDPIKFVKDAYFNIITSLKSQTEKVAELIFGSESDYLKLLFDRSNSKDALYNIRGKLAHGDIALCSKEDELLVREHLNKIRKISWEFLVRIILRLKPSEKVPSWSRSHRIEFTLDDPRNTLCYSSEIIFLKGTDWRIKANWID
jgi:hypothetical protein